LWAVRVQTSLALTASIQVAVVPARPHPRTADKECRRATLHAPRAADDAAGSGWNRSRLHTPPTTVCLRPALEPRKVRSNALANVFAIATVRRAESAPTESPGAPTRPSSRDTSHGFRSPAATPAPRSRSQQLQRFQCRQCSQSRQRIPLRRIRGPSAAPSIRPPRRMPKRLARAARTSGKKYSVALDSSQL
jgi:hypothetical protein